VEKWYQIIDINGKLTNGMVGKGDVETTWKNIKKLLPETLDNMRILDLGCNAGMYCVKSILMGAKEAIGIEFNDEYFKQALFIKKYMDNKFNTNMNIHYIHGRIQNHIERLGIFDIIFAFSILYHIDNSHIHKVCKWMSKNTKNIIGRFRNNNDIIKYSEIFKSFGFHIYKQFEETNIFKDKRKKYLVQFIKR